MRCREANVGLLWSGLVRNGRARGITGVVSHEGVMPSVSTEVLERAEEGMSTGIHIYVRVHA